MLLIVNIKGEAIYCNKAFRRYIRKPGNKILGKNLWNIIWDVNKKTNKCLLDAVEINKKRPFVEINVKNKWLKISADPILDTNRNLKNIIIVVSDITERINNLRELEVRENKYKDLVELANVAIASDNKDGKLIYFNKQFADLFGYSIDEIYTLSHNDLVHPDDLEMVSKIHNSRFKGEKILSRYEFRGIKKDGSIVYIDISVNEKIEANGEIVGTRSYLRDITEKKKFIEELERALEKARESDRLKTAFLSNISHEIRTPLNGIMGFSKLILKKDITNKDKKTFAEIIDESSNQLLYIIKDILDISNIEIGSVKIYNIKFNLNDLLSDVYEHYKMIFKNKKIDFSLKYDKYDEPVEMNSDKGKLKQIISNLLNNALKFTEKGHVDFGYKIIKNFVEFYVTDTGIGIEKELHEKIFDCFRQAEIDYTRRYGGNGLGLSISKGFIEVLGGKIWLKSTVNNLPDLPVRQAGDKTGGTTFYFTIPFKPTKTK